MRRRHASRRSRSQAGPPAPGHRRSTRRCRRDPARRGRPPLPAAGRSDRQHPLRRSRPAPCAASEGRVRPRSGATLRGTRSGGCSPRRRGHPRPLLRCRRTHHRRRPAGRESRGPCGDHRARRPPPGRAAYLRQQPPHATRDSDAARVLERDGHRRDWRRGRQDRRGERLLSAGGGAERIPQAVRDAHGVWLERNRELLRRGRRRPGEPRRGLVLPGHVARRQARRRLRGVLERRRRGAGSIVKLGLQINAFTWPGGAEAIGPTLGRVVETADQVGFDSIWVMDHFFQIRGGGPPEAPMLEGMTALGFMAAHSKQARLGLMVGGIHYRNPGLWIKATTTLDVLSGGRAWFGIGAAWNEEESRALGFPFPPLGERFGMLEETLQMANEMWSGGRGSEGRHEGKHYTATRLLNSPQAISRPRVPIMTGGGGEQKTLRLVAQYADATNVFGNPERIRHKYAVLREHCERLGRPYDEIERSTLQGIDLERESPAEVVDWFGQLGEGGAQHVIASVRGVAQLGPLERIGAEVIPQLRAL